MFSEKLPTYAYFPFGGGPRQCIGNYFAMMEVVLVLATIGRRLKLSLAPDEVVELSPAMLFMPIVGSLLSSEFPRFLRSPPGNRMEALKGERKGQYSIRVNDQFRVCFRWTKAGPEDVEIVDYH